MRRDLALWITTCYAISGYERLQKLRLPWDKWDRELYLAAFRLAATLRLLGTESISKAQALKMTGAARPDLEYALELLTEVGLTPWAVSREQSPDVVTALATHRERLDVRLEARALEDMLLAVAEGYKVGPGKGIKYTEVFGLCFGSVRRSTPRHESHELRVNVSRIATQMRAKATASEVTPNSKSLAAHLDVATKFFPHLEVVGDYHSHPYNTFGKLIQARGWEYSEADEASLEPFIEEVMSQHNRPHFSLVVAVAEGGKKGKPVRKKANVIQVPIGSLYFIVGAYRITMDARYDEKVTLFLPGDI
jgi:proteasome lid subunit RPN8/RPN11